MKKVLAGYGLDEWRGGRAKAIVGITGKKGVGKTTAADYLCKTQGFVKHSFADPLKAMAFQFIKSFGYSDKETHYFIHENKVDAIPLIGCSARRIMQTLGTEWGRCQIGHDTWVKVARLRIKTTLDANIVFDDIRFENEAELIRQLGGVIIHVDGETSEVDHHASERGIDFYTQDIRISNHDGAGGFNAYFLLDVESALINRWNGFNFDSCPDQESA